MTDDDRTVTVRIPLVFKKHGGRKTVISPDGGTWVYQSPLVDCTLVRALARAFRWQRLLDEGNARDPRRSGESRRRQPVPCQPNAAADPSLAGPHRGDPGGATAGRNAAGGSLGRISPMSGAVNGNARRPPHLPKGLPSFSALNGHSRSATYAPRHPISRRSVAITFALEGASSGSSWRARTEPVGIRMATATAPVASSPFHLSPSRNPTYPLVHWRRRS